MSVILLLNLASGIKVTFHHHQVTRSSKYDNGRLFVPGAPSTASGKARVQAHQMCREVLCSVASPETSIDKSLSVVVGDFPEGLQPAASEVRDAMMSEGDVGSGCNGS